MAVEFDPTFMPTLGGGRTAKPERSGIFVRGISAGIDDLQGMLGASAQGTGMLLGLDGLTQYGRNVSQANQRESAASGRPDLETAPWREDGSPVLPWLGYQASKQIPLIGAYMLGGKAFRMTGAQAPAFAEGIGMNLPRALGGAGLSPGASFAVRRAAVQRGARTTAAEFGQDLTGGAIAGVPIAFGSMMQEADAKPGGATREDAMKAAALSPLYSALDAVQPAALKGLLKKGQSGKFFKRVGTAMFAGAAAEVPQEGMQTAMEMWFRPDLTLNEKMHNIVDAAVTGGAVGGVFGGAAGIRRTKVEDAASVTETDLEQRLDQFLQLPAPTAYTDAGGRTQMSGMDQLRETPFDPATQDPVDIPTSQTALPGPEDIDNRSAVDGSTMVAGRNREGGRFAPGQSITEQPAVVEPSRSYSGWTTPELQTAVNLLSDKREAGTLKPGTEVHLAPMMAELEFRKEAARQDDVSDPAGAAARDLSQLGGVEQSSAEPAPATTNINAELVGDVKRLPKSIQTELANARSEDEVRAIAFREATKTNDRGELIGGKWRETLGKNTGILDEEGKPTALASTIGAQLEASEAASTLVEPQGAPTGAAEPTTGLAPSREEIGTAPDINTMAQNYGVEIETNSTDPDMQPQIITDQLQRGVEMPAAAQQTPAEFAAEWKANINETGQRTEGVKQLKKGLGRPRNREEAQRALYAALGREGEVGDGLEALAITYGVLDEQKQLTPLALDIAQYDAIDRKDQDSAAAAQGYTGQQASVFRKGVDGHLNREAVPTFRSTDNLRAYMAGRAWAIEHNSVPRVGSRHKTEEMLRTTKQTGPQTQVDKKRTAVPAEQLRQQTWNNQIDEMAVDTTTAPTELAALKRMVAEGASNEQIAAAIDLVQRGESLAPLESEPDRTEFVGERPVRGAPKVSSGERELDRAKQEIANQRGNKKAIKERQHLIRKRNALRQIDAAFSEGLITAVERLQMIEHARNNRISLVEDLLQEAKSPSTLPDAVNPDLLADQASAEDQEELTRIYEQPEFNNEVRSRFSVDVQTYLGGKLSKLQDNLRKIIRRTIEAVMAIAIVFNSHSLLPFSGGEAQAMTTRAPIILVTEVPADAAAGMSEAAQQTYRAMAHTAMKIDRGFIIGDKPNGMIHIFGKDGRLISTAPSLYGVTPGDIEGPAGTTPAGTFRVEFAPYKEHGKPVAGMGMAGYLKHLKTGQQVTVGSWGSVAIHKVWLGRPAEDRVGRLTSETAGDNRISAGCINTTEETLVNQIAPNMKELNGGLVMISPETGDTSMFEAEVAQNSDVPASDPGAPAKQTALAPGMVATTRDARKRRNAASKRRFEARQARQQSGRRSPIPPSAAETNNRAQGFVSSINRHADKAMDTLGTYGNTTSAGKRLLKLMVGWMPFTHMVEHYSKVFPELRLLLDAHAGRRATTAVFAHLYNTPKLMVETMKQTKEGRAALDVIDGLMELTAWNIDYSKSWRDNDHLHGADNEDVLKRKHAEGYRAYNALKAQKDKSGNLLGYNKLIDDYRRINEMEHYASMALALRRLVGNDKASAAAIPSYETDPVAVFRNDSTKHNPVDAREYWRKVLNDLIGEIDTYTDAVSSADDVKAKTAATPLAKYTKEVKKGITAMDDAPYFHLGRSGEHMIFASARLGPDKKVDQTAIEHIAQVLYDEAGVTDARITKDLGKPQIFLRVETPEQRDLITGVMQKLHAEGWLNPDVDVKSGPREEGEYLPERTRQEMNNFINAFRSDPFFDEAEDMTDDEKKALSALKTRVVAVAYDVWLDMLPDTATSKVLTHRESKPGYSKDMARSFAYRYNIGVNSIASLAAEPEINHAFEEMRKAREKARIASNNMDVDTISTLYAEAAKREAQRPLASQSDGYDQWRAWTHAFYLGLSPSYMLVNLTQMGVMLWPELSKNFGFVETAKAMAKVTPMAFDILKATMTKGYEAGGFLRAADGVITQEALQEALGTDKSTTEFLMNMIGSGLIDIGSAARELATTAEGRDDSTQGKVLRFAASAGLYSETLTRLVAALSARELHKKHPEKVKMSETDYAQHVTRESMLEYSTWNTARLMGKMGAAGPFTPVMMSFLQYSTQVTWKLYRELSTAFLDHSSTDEQKKAAKAFLMNHLVAVTTLAGTLGLPFATVAAMVIEKMVDAFGDDEEPFDVSAAWRNYLAGVFGKDVGEMMARGVPRAAGIDLSSRVGEQNMLPFSQWLTDRRKWKEATSEAALRSIGAPFSMVGSIATGAGKISDGDFLGGMSEMMPNALKGPTKAYQMSSDGYVDMQGNKLPMTPAATAYLAQLMGFTPAEKAEYSEVRGDQARRRGELIEQAKVLRDGIVDAIIAGDSDEARSWLTEAQSFDRDNPKFAVIPDIEASIKRRMKLQAVSARTNTPIGVAQDDYDGQRLTAYGNIDYRAQ